MQTAPSSPGSSPGPLNQMCWVVGAWGRRWGAGMGCCIFFLTP